MLTGPVSDNAAGLFYWTAEVNTLEQTIGNTPLVKLQRLGPDNGSEIWIKLEGNNPAGSVKDRAALSMIVEAEKRGEIKPGDVLIEATSGNTGIALAMIAALKGYQHEAADARQHEPGAPCGNARLRCRADPGHQRAGDGRGSRSGRWRWPSAAKASCWISSTIRITLTPTTPPPARKSGGRRTGRITHFVSSMGTTGTITGVSRFLREQAKR